MSIEVGRATEPAPRDTIWQSRGMARAMLLVFLVCRAYAGSQEAPPSPDRPWHSAGEAVLQEEGRFVRPPEFPLDSRTNYSLGELIDLAETHNPDTRVAWESARAQAATLGLARSELYPAITAVALSQTHSRQRLLRHGLLSADNPGIRGGVRTQLHGIRLWRACRPYQRGHSPASGRKLVLQRCPSPSHLPG